MFFSLFCLQILVVRNDLKMGKGKIAAQCRYMLNFLHYAGVRQWIFGLCCSFVWHWMLLCIIVYDKNLCFTLVVMQLWVSIKSYSIGRQKPWTGTTTSYFWICICTRYLCLLSPCFMCFLLTCRWEMCAQPKVVVKIESEEDMLVLQVSITHNSSTSQSQALCCFAFVLKLGLKFSSISI